MGSNIAPPPPPHTFFHFLNIVQYLLVHCTIPSILGSHPPYPTSPPTPNIAFTSTLTPPHLTPSATETHPLPPHRTPPPKKKIFFLNFHKKFNSLFTSTLTPPPTRPLQLTPPPYSPPNFFFEFSQKLQFFVHIHPDPPPPHRPPPPPPPKKKIFFFLNFHKNFNSSFTSTLTPQPDPPDPPPPPPPNFFFLEFSQKLQFRSHPP